MPVAEEHVDALVVAVLKLLIGDELIGTQNIFFALAEIDVIGVFVDPLPHLLGRQFFLWHLLTAERRDEHHGCQILF